MAHDKRDLLLSECFITLHPFKSNLLFLFPSLCFFYPPILIFHLLTLFLPYLFSGEDTWMIRFHLSDTASSKALAGTWNALAARLEGVASVGAFDLGVDPHGDTGMNSPQTGQKDPVSLAVLEQHGLTLESLRLGPIVRYCAVEERRGV